MSVDWVMLALVVVLAATAEVITGFGSTVVSVALGSFFVPLEVLIPVLVLLNLVISGFIVTRHYNAINHEVLWKQIIPFMTLGFPLGIAAFNYSRSLYLKLGFGLFVTIAAGAELWKLRISHREDSAPLPGWKSSLLLVAAGIIHGLYASGGPLVVYFAGRHLKTKQVFRSTLSALWLLLSFLLTVNFFFSGRLSLQVLKTAFILLPVLPLGFWAGEWLHRYIDEQIFQTAVYLLLFLAGLSLILETGLI